MRLNIIKQSSSTLTSLNFHDISIRLLHLHYPKTSLRLFTDWSVVWETPSAADQLWQHHMWWKHTHCGSFSAPSCGLVSSCLGWWRPAVPRQPDTRCSLWSRCCRCTLPLRSCRRKRSPLRSKCLSCSSEILWNRRSTLTLSSSWSERQWHPGWSALQRTPGRVKVIGQFELLTFLSIPRIGA